MRWTRILETMMISTANVASSQRDFVKSWDTGCHGRAASVNFLGGELPEAPPAQIPASGTTAQRWVGKWSHAPVGSRGRPEGPAAPCTTASPTPPALHLRVAVPNDVPLVELAEVLAFPVRAAAPRSSGDAPPPGDAAARRGLGLAPQRLPEALDLAQRLGMARAGQDMANAAILQDLAEGALAAPGVVLGAVVGEAPPRTHRRSPSPRSGPRAPGLRRRRRADPPCFWEGEQCSFSQILTRPTPPMQDRGSREERITHPN
jgi:hypothetical protein